MCIINKTDFIINENNYYNIKTKKKQIVIGLSMRKDNNHIIRLKHKEFGQSKKWNMYTISRNGDIIKHFDDNYYSNFIDKKNTDKKIISIVIENMGYLEQTIEGDYINWLNEACSNERVFEKKWLGKHYWELIDNKQFESLIWLCNEMCLKHNIPNKTIGFSHYHKDAAKFNGILFKSNYFEDGIMYNPSIDINKLNKELNNDND